MSSKKKIYIYRGVLIALPIIIFAVNKYMLANEPPARKRPPQEKEQSVEVEPLQRQAYTIKVRSQGLVEPYNELTLVPEVSGSIAHLSDKVNEGQFISEGDVLIKIDSRNYQIALDRAVADLKRAEANLKIEKINNVKYETAVSEAEARLSNASQSYLEEAARARQSEKEWEDLNQKDKPGDLVLRLPQLKSAKARLDAAKADLKQRIAEKALAEPNVTLAEQAVVSARAQRDRAKLDLERCTIKAPYDAKVMSRHVNPGQYINAGTALAVIYPTSKVEVQLPLTATQLGFIKLPVQHKEDKTTVLDVELVKNEAGERYSWKAEARRSQSMIDSKSRQLFIIAEIKEPFKEEGNRPALLPGTYVQAYITGRQLQDVFIVDRRHLQTGDKLLLVNSASELVERPVHVVYRDDEVAVINSGIKDGDRLCTTRMSFYGKIKVNILNKEAKGSTN